MKKSYYPLALGLLVALSGCATVRDVYLPDGTLGEHISCDGNVLTYADCTQKAGDICGPKGYTVLNQSGEAIPYSETSSYVNRYSAGYNSSSGTIIQRDMFIRCN